MAPREAKGITVISPAGNDSRGFSLLELVLVLLLLALSTTIVLPNIEKGLQDREIRAAALGLAATARDLRSRALMDGIPHQLILNLAQNSYLAGPGREIALPSDVKFAQVRGGEALGNEARKFYFFPNGSSLGGEIILSDSRNAASYSIRLEPLTGKVAVGRSSLS